MKFKSGRYTGVQRYLLNDHGYAMSSSELLDALGKNGWPVKGGKPIPADLDFATSLNGVNIHVRSKQKKGMEKRVFAECPECHTWVEAGHLHQHVEAKHA